MASSDSVPKVGGRRRLHDPGDLQPELARVDPIEQPDPRPEQDGSEVELQLVEQADIQGLLHGGCAAGDVHVLAAGGFASLCHGAGDPVGDEGKCRAALADPRLPRVVGEDEDRRAERGWVGPADFALVEHAAAHHIGAGAGELLLGDLMVTVDSPPDWLCRCRQASTSYCH
jgi:hypothetical protein